MLLLAELQDTEERLKETHSHGLKLASKKHWYWFNFSLNRSKEGEQTMLGNSSETEVYRTLLQMMSTLPLLFHGSGSTFSELILVDHKITEPIRSKGTFPGHLVQLPSKEQEHLQLSQVLRACLMPQSKSQWIPCSPPPPAFPPEL